MTERPILFSAPMVRAILAGTKTQTRRAVKPQPEGRAWYPKPGSSVIGADLGDLLNKMPGYCPYGQPGDRLYVREKWGTCEAFDNVAPRDLPGFVAIKYFADNQIVGATAGHGLMLKSRPSIHMPRRVSRILLKIESVRVERLQDISEADAEAEGCLPMFPDDVRGASNVYAYSRLWESINGRDSWDANPWVWCVEFRRI